MNTNDQVDKILEYRIVCDDDNHQCGPVFKTYAQVLADWDTYTRGHDDSHGHVVQSRQPMPWAPANATPHDYASLRT